MSDPSVRSASRRRLQGSPVGGVGDSEPRRALGFEREGALDRSVPVAVGFDHRANGHAFADVLLHGVKVFSEGS